MKKALAFLLTVLLSLSISGCVLLSTLSNELSPVIHEKIEKEKNMPRIGFAYSGDDDYTDTLFIDVNELQNYESDLSRLSSSFFCDHLSEKEKVIYHAFEYALDNCYEQIVLNEFICPETDDLSKILLFLSMDSPLVEQNLNYSLFSLSFSFPLDSENSNIHIPFNGYSIEIANFSRELFQTKLLAIDKGKEIVENMPTDLNVTEKAEYLYRYVTENIKYEGYNDDELHPFLHDALLLNKSHCDGTSNALSLLYNLSGIPCFEKISMPIETVPGHTWNCAYLDGVWYNFDATIDPDEFSSIGCYFAFSDDLVDVIPRYQEQMPPCSIGLYMNSSGHFQSESSDDVYETIYNSIATNGTYCLLTFDSFDYDNCTPMLQDLVNALDRPVTTSYYKGTNKTVFLFECDE